MFNVIYALFFRELKTRFGKNRKLGYIWVVGEPMVQVLIVLAIISTIRSFTNFAMPKDMSIFMFLASGIIPFFMFRNILSQIISGISGNLALFVYKPVKPIHVFIARTLLECFIYFFIFIMLMIIMAWVFDMNVTPCNFLEVYLMWGLLAFSGFTLGLNLAILCHFFDFVKSVVIYIGVLIYLSSAVIYPSWVLPENIYEILLFNPWFHIMEILRMNYFENYPPIKDGISVLYPIYFNIIVLFVGLWFYYYKRQELSAIKS